MTRLTKLTLKAALDGLKAKSFSSVEITKAHIEAIEAARPLNAFVLETPEKALSMAAASDARRIAPARAARWKARRWASRTCSAPRACQTTAGSKILATSCRPTNRPSPANLWRDGAVMLGKLNMDEFAMGSSNETSAFGPVVNPWRRRAPTRPDPGRLVGRLGLGRRRRPVPGRHGHRHRRLDPPARRLHRHRRHQADLRPLLALGHGRLRLLARPGRPDRQERRGRGHPAQLDERPRPQGLHQPRRPVPDFASFVGKSVKGLRIGVPKEYRRRRHARRDREAVGQGIAWLKAAGCEIVEISLPHTKYALPAYYIVAPAEASSNLARYDGMRYGLRAPGDQPDRPL
jgi:aspartyl-tRNA(Asn)/glutamyl-tRNA(Gln) amidotransferase subunit A